MGITRRFGDGILSCCGVVVCVGTTVLTVRAMALMDLKLDYRAIGTVGEGIRKVRCIRR